MTWKMHRTNPGSPVSKAEVGLEMVTRAGGVSSTMSPATEDPALRWVHRNRSARYRSQAAAAAVAELARSLARSAGPGVAGLQQLLGEEIDPEFFDTCHVDALEGDTLWIGVSTACAVSVMKRRWETTLLGRVRRAAMPGVRRIRFRFSADNRPHPLSREGACVGEASSRDVRGAGP